MTVEVKITTAREARERFNMESNPVMKDAFLDIMRDINAALDENQFVVSIPRDKMNPYTVQCLKALGYQVIPFPRTYRITWWEKE